MEVWRCRDLPGYLAAFSERGEAPPEEPSATAHLAREFAAQLGVPGISIARATQVHGHDVLEATENLKAGETALLGQGDILLTRQANVALVVQTADCVPILLAAGGAVAAIHAGWRGTAGSAAAVAVRALCQRGEAAPSLVRAFIGPAIGACCYEVGSDVAAVFPTEFAQPAGNGKFHLDLKGANRVQLEAEGVPPANITVLPFCTMCGGQRFASYRRDGAGAGRMIALIARL